MGALTIVVWLPIRVRCSSVKDRSACADMTSSDRTVARAQFEHVSREGIHLLERQTK